MMNYKAVPSGLDISRRVADCLEASAITGYQPGERVRAIQAINDVLQGRSTRTVEELLAEKKFYHPRGLIYFTDGYGTFPVKMPPYETAFVFLQDNYRDVDVPPWAVKLILGEEELLYR